MSHLVCRFFFPERWFGTSFFIFGLLLNGIEWVVYCFPYSEQIYPVKYHLGVRGVVDAYHAVGNTLLISDDPRLFLKH